MGPPKKNTNLTQTFLEGSVLFPKYEKPLKKAFYNGLALFLICACSFFTWGSFIILEPFLRPLFWALLCGSVLHPLKYKISSNFKTWIVWAEKTDFRLPLIFQIASSPIKLILDISEITGEFLILHWLKIFGLVFLIPLFLITYNYTPRIFVCLSLKCFTIFTAALYLLLDIFESTTVMVTFLAAFLISLTFLWNTENEEYFLKASYVMWFALSAHAANYLYLIRLPAFLALHLIFITGFILSRKTGSTLQPDFSKGTVVEATIDESKSESQVIPDLPGKDKNMTANLQVDNHQQAETNIKNALHEIGFFIGDNTSDIYIYWVSVACFITVLLQLGWILFCCVALLPIVYTVRRLCKYFGITYFVDSKFTSCKIWLSRWYLVRKHVLIPAPVSYLNSICVELRSRLLHCLRESSDATASIMVILVLVFFVVFGSTFLVIQAYAEGIYMVKVGGSVINQTVVHNPELMQLLPEGWEEKMDSVLNNAYTYGREALSKLVRNMLSGVSEDKTEELEKRALEVWDRVYQAWMINSIEQKTTIGPKVTSSAVYQTWDHFLDAMHKTPELFSMSALTRLAQNNMAMLTSGLESVWELIRGNASLVLSALLTGFSLVFSHGFALLNFLISMIVFLTALFYLLSSSRKLYKPVEVITTISPEFGSRLAFAMENAVKEVLTASFRLALFYGMWTWLIHNLFQMNIVYIPSVLAAMLAVVPALGTYWACLPAVLDLWLAQGKKIHALTLIACQFLPTLFVDATIYTEIKEGHPYLTGLSVAGGLFCMGMEGAIIGPLILCCLYVVVNMSSSIMQEATTPTVVQTIH